MEALSLEEGEKKSVGLKVMVSIETNLFRDVNGLVKQNKDKTLFQGATLEIVDNKEEEGQKASK